MKQNIINLTLIAAVSLCLIAACGGSSANSKPEAPKVTAFGEICQTNNHGKDITVEGYVWTTKSVNCKRTSRFTRLCAVELYDNPQHTGKPITVRFKEGSGSSEMESLPEKFSPADLKFKTVNGIFVTANDKLRLSGYTENKPDAEDVKEFGCFINVKKIEKP